MKTSNTKHNALALIIDGVTVAITQELTAQFNWDVCPVEYAILAEDGQVKWVTHGQAEQAIEYATLMGAKLNINAVTHISI